MSPHWPLGEARLASERGHHGTASPYAESKVEKSSSKAKSFIAN